MRLELTKDVLCGAHVWGSVGGGEGVDVIPFVVVCDGLEDVACDLLKGIEGLHDGHREYPVLLRGCCEECGCIDEAARVWECWPVRNVMKFVIVVVCVELWCRISKLSQCRG